MLNIPVTEQVNPDTAHIDTLSAQEIVLLMNAEDMKVATAVAQELDHIALAVEGIVGRLAQEGRLIYVGAGTSGRLGVLDAAECPPTFGTPPEMVQGLIAGGPTALVRAIEGAEDDPAAGQEDIVNLNVGASDTVVGITASGQTPYVIGALTEARDRGAFTIGLTCSRPSPVGDLVDVEIAAIVGPEVIAGSTRLKAGTAQKMILNMLSTGSMILLGKTYRNLMVDIRATSQKLQRRAPRIVGIATGLPENEALRVLRECKGDVKIAIVVANAGVAPEEARRRLAASNGRVRRALEMDKRNT